MGERSVGGLVLAVLRTIADVTQKEADGRIGKPGGSTTYYERRAEPSPEVLEDYRRAYRFPEPYVRRAWGFVEEGLALLGDGPALDPEEVARREFEERSFATFRDVLDRIDAFAEAHLEHRGAPYLWRQLARHTAKERLAMVAIGQDFWSPGLCVFLCEKSVEAAANDGREAEALARLAAEIARRVPGSEARRARLEGLAQAFVGNALRVRGQLPAADEAFALSADLWTRGAGTFHDLIDPSRVLDLEASFRLAQRSLPEALELLERAFPLAQTDRARGRILLVRAKTYEEKGEHEKALAVLDQAEPHVFGAGDPYHIFVLAINRLCNLCDLGHVGETVHGLCDVKELAIRLQSPLQLTRCRWLEARTLAGLGEKEEAIAAFREVKEVFSASKYPYDHALVQLERCLLLLEDRRTAEVRALASELKPIFVSQGVHREALAALRLFTSAALQEQATVELAKSTLNFLRRSRYNSEFHFELGYGAPFPGDLS
jgi:tetratricopeptide (TPR) repeat protein